MSDTVGGGTDRESEPTRQLAAEEIPTAAVSAGAEPAPGGLPAGAAVLTVVRGRNAGTQYILSAATTVLGRSSDCDIVLDDSAVSRRHAEIRRGETGFILADRGSLNGTYLNRAPVDRVHLSDGDHIQVGQFRLQFQAPAAR
jgi:pSer/pThr/pTyr-binding forkhead associated (FHA) protein